jgi:hypothetical protein
MRERAPASLLVLGGGGRCGHVGRSVTSFRQRPGVQILPLGRFPWKRRWIRVSQSDEDGDARRTADGESCGKASSNSHQQAGFTAGTVADNDELSADFSHGCAVRRRRGLWALELMIGKVCFCGDDYRRSMVDGCGIPERKMEKAEGV